MPTIPESMHNHTTSQAIFKWHEKKQDEETPRPYLGASIIGCKCDRALWYGFRQVKIVKHEGRMLRLFQTGHLEEARFVAELRGIGCEIYDVDPTTGEQFEIKDVFGHFSGHADGVGRGMPEGPKSWALLEFKTHNAKSFYDLVKKGVEKSKPKHWIQMQIYMSKMKLERALYLARNKDTDDLYSEWIHVDKKLAEEQIERASRIIFAAVPPERMSNDKAYYECKFCDYYDVCHQNASPCKNCRTCAKATPLAEGDSGEWLCHRYSEKVPFEVQITGCDEHLFIPPLLVYATPIDADDNFVEYEHNKTKKTFINATKSAIEDPDFRDSATVYSSDELAVMHESLIGDKFVSEIKETFPGAEVVSCSGI